MSGRRVVVTGIGAVSPLGIGADALGSRWIAGECGIDDGAGRCDEFEATEHMSRKEARRADRFTQLALVAADEAIADAGWEDGPPGDLGRVGCIVGTGIGGLGSLEEQEGVLRDRGPKQVSPLSVPLMMGNAGAAAVAMRHGLHGQTYGVVSACAAGAHALGAATRMIQAGDADAAVTGGAEAAITAIGTAAFAAMGATSPTGISRPFDARRDGFVIGEGAGILVLEEAEAAERRGARVRAEVIGYAATSDAHHLTAPEPSGREAARAIGLALADAGLEPGDVDYVNAHGTSTPLNDRSETEALKAALGSDAARVRPRRRSRRSGTCSGPRARWRRWRRSRRCARASPARRSPTRSPTKGSTSTTSPTRRGRSSAGRTAPARSHSSPSRTRSASAATTRSSAWRCHERRDGTDRAGKPAVGPARASRASLRPWLIRADSLGRGIDPRGGPDRRG